MTFQDRKLPVYLKKYFWECDFDKLSLNNYSFFITERILNYGNAESIKWMLGKIDLQLLTEVIARSKNIDKKTKNYWKIILDEQ